VRLSTLLHILSADFDHKHLFVSTASTTYLGKRCAGMASSSAGPRLARSVALTNITVLVAGREMQ
jgi:hypothetical protein